MDVPSARTRRLPAAAFARARSLVRLFVRALVRVLIAGSFLAACRLGGVASAQAQRLPEVGALPDDHVADRHWPNDPLFAQQWPLHNTGQGGDVVDADVDAPEAWRLTRGSPQI